MELNIYVFSYSILNLSCNNVTQRLINCNDMYETYEKMIGYELFLFCYRSHKYFEFLLRLI